MRNDDRFNTITRLTYLSIYLYTYMCVCVCSCSGSLGKFGNLPKVTNTQIPFVSGEWSVISYFNMRPRASVL